MLTDVSIQEKDGGFRRYVCDITGEEQHEQLVALLDDCRMDGLIDDFVVRRSRDFRGEYAEMRDWLAGLRNR